MSSVHVAPPKVYCGPHRFSKPVRAQGIDKINRPSRLRRAIGFDLCYLSTSKASPNDSGIVIIVIIIVGEEFVFEHRGAIIAQSLLDFSRCLKLGW